MVISKVTRVSNPRRRRSSGKRRNPNKRLSLKQKLHFGTKRQRNAAKLSLHRKRSNPNRRRVVARRVARRAVANPVRRRKLRKAANPAHMVTLGLLNPHKRRRKAAAKKNPVRRKAKMAKARKSYRRRRSVATNPRRRRRNSVRVIVRRRRARRMTASNPRRRRRSYRANSRRRRHGSVSRRNPQLFGHTVGAFEMAKAIAGGLAGVAITKAVPNMLPASLTSGSAFMNTAVSVVVAVGAGMLVKMLVKGDPTLGDAVLFGGLMQAGSVALNSFLPSVGSVIGLQGLGNGIGDLVAGKFPIPMNPIMAGMAPPALPAPMPSAGGHAASTGVGAIYNPFGRAM